MGKINRLAILASTILILSAVFSMPVQAGPSNEPMPSTDLSKRLSGLAHAYGATLTAESIDFSILGNQFKSFGDLKVLLYKINIEVDKPDGKLVYLVAQLHAARNNRKTNMAFLVKLLEKLKLFDAFAIKEIKEKFGLINQKNMDALYKYCNGEYTLNCAVGKNGVFFLDIRYTPQSSFPQSLLLHK